MKRIIFICLFVVFAIPAWSPAAVIGPARVGYVDGDILFRSPDTDEWLPVVVNTPFDEGDSVWCPEDSRVEIQLPDGTIVRLDGGTQLDLIANEDGFIHLHLASGHLYLRTAQTAKDNSLQIDADDTTVLPSARTRLRIDMLPNSMEDVAITKGSAYVEGNGSRTRVRAGEHILLEERHSEILPLNPADSWEIWNVDRDRTQSRSARADSYLPEELRGHSSELDANGSWVSVPEYGMVWRPTVIVSDEWAPYRSGRWIWKGDDYVWLSFESWGWVPYHYGRWAVVSGFGWCWVPPVRGDVYWGPGYVGWYGSGNQVGWTPLAPGERYYGHRNYGRHSVNITNININTSNVVYRNRTKPGGLTVLPHNDFLNGKSALHQPPGKASVSISVSIGSPSIKPLRETRMPVVRQTPPRVAPPKRERRDSRDLRDKFPRVTPVPNAERRRQQTIPATVVPAAPTVSKPQVREKNTALPAVAPAVRPPDPDSQPSQTTPLRRDERRQPSTPQQTVPQPSQPVQPAPPVPQPQQPAHQQRDERRQAERPPQGTTQPAPPVAQGSPPVSGNAPQHTEQPRRAATPSDSQSRPPAAPSRMENRPAATPAPTTVPPTAAPPSRVVQPQKESAPKQVQPKKIWNVATPENGTEKDSREKETRGKERR